MQIFSVQSLRSTVGHSPSSQSAVSETPRRPSRRWVRLCVAPVGGEWDSASPQATQSLMPRCPQTTPSLLYSERSLRADWGDAESHSPPTGATQSLTHRRLGRRGVSLCAVPSLRGMHKSSNISAIYKSIFFISVKHVLRHIWSDFMPKKRGVISHAWVPLRDWFFIYGDDFAL